MEEKNYSITGLTKEEYDYYFSAIKREREKEEKRKNDLAEISKIYYAITDFLSKGGQIGIDNEYGESSAICGNDYPYDNSGAVFLDDLTFYYNKSEYSKDDILED